MTTRTGLDTTELKAMSEAVRVLRALAPAAGKRALMLAGFAIRTVAAKAAPVRTGLLKSLHQVDQSQLSADEPQVRVGATASYAAAVHAVHPTKAGWFLFTVLNEGPGIVRRSMERAVEQEARRIAKQGGASGGSGGGGR